jgi:lipopolysaccharide transport system permease protein
MSASDHNTQRVIEITNKDPFFPDIAESWRSRQLAVMLALRNIKVRYKQTILGSAWIIIQPILLTGALTLVLGGFLHVPSDGLPYALFAFTGTAMWSAFQRTINDTAISLASSGGIILKVYFPRILVPSAALLTAVLDFAPIYIVLILAAFAYNAFAGWPILLSPLFMLLALVLAFGAGLWVTMLDTIYRDVRLVIPSMLQLAFYASPVMYSTSVVPQRWQWLYHLNPLVGLLQGFRWSLIAGASPPAALDIGWSVMLAVLLLGGGMVIFARLERFAVDRI